MVGTSRLGFFEAVILLVLSGGLGGGGGLPPLPEDPVLSKAAPPKCLLYATWAEVGTPDPKSKNHIEQLLADPEVKQWAAAMKGRTARMMTMMGPQQDVNEVLEPGTRLLEAIEGKAGAVWLTDVTLGERGAPIPQGAMLLRIDKQDDQKTIADAVNRLLAVNPDELKSSEVVVEEFRFSRVTNKGPFPAVTWGFAGGYLVIGVGDGQAEAAMKRARGEVPAWLNQAREDLAVPRVASLVHLDIPATLVSIRAAMAGEGGEDQFDAFVAVSGLDAVHSFSLSRGMDIVGCLDKWQLSVSGTPRGVLSLIDVAPLRNSDLRVVDLESPVAIAFQLDLGKLLDVVLEAVQRFDPDHADDLHDQLAGLEQALGVRLREDLFAALGDTWKVFAQPGQEGLTTGWAAAIEVRDGPQFGKLHGQMLARIREILAQTGGPNVETSTIAETEVHSLRIPVFGMPAEPSWCVTDKELLIALFPDTLRAILRRKKDAASLADSPVMRRVFATQARQLAMAHVDTRLVFETLMDMGAGMAMGVMPLPGVPVPGEEGGGPEFPKDAFLPHLYPSLFTVTRTPNGLLYTGRHTFHTPVQNVLSTMAAGMLPAIQSSRSKAMRVQSMNQVKQIELALHGFSAANAHLPAGYSADAEGTPLLSWRVHILPYLGEADLYNQFRLDEPWDSPHNKTLIEKMPAMYRAPNSKAEAGKTNYLGVGGADGVFVKPEPGGNAGIRFQDVRDGISATISIVEAGDDLAIAWTQPGDFAPDPENPMKGLGGLHVGKAFIAGFLDGRVAYLSHDLAAEAFLAMCTKSGGEVPEAGADKPEPRGVFEAR